MIRVLLLMYAVLFLCAFFVSDRVIFGPPDPSYKDNPNLIKLTTADGTIISALHLSDPSTRFTLLYSHGDAEDMWISYPMLVKFNNMGLNVFAYDYHGYGTSGGVPSEKAVYQDIDAAYEYITKELSIPPDRVILYGYALGSGPSVDLAARKPVGGLILESPFVTSFRVFTVYPILPFDKFNNIRKIHKVNVPVMIIHGTKDDVIPFSNGRKLYSSAREPKESMWVEGAGHFDLISAAGLDFNRRIISFINNTVLSKEAESDNSDN